MPEWCDAGRRAGLEGLWGVPCTKVSKNRHLIGAPALIEPLVLCEDHFQQILRMGLVTEPHIGQEDFKRREASKQQR